MKAKVLEYSSSDPNKVVVRNRELEKIAESVYSHLYEKNKHDEDDDMFAIIIKVGNVYFEEVQD